MSVKDSRKIWLIVRGILFSDKSRYFSDQTLSKLVSTEEKAKTKCYSHPQHLYISNENLSESRRNLYFQINLIEDSFRILWSALRSFVHTDEILSKEGYTNLLIAINLCLFERKNVHDIERYSIEECDFDFTLIGSIKWITFCNLLLDKIGS